MAIAAIAITRGDTTTITLTEIGAMTTRTKLWITFKRDARDSDAAAVMQVTESDGLVTLNGASPTTGQTAVLAITNAGVGTGTLVLSAAATAALPVGSGVYDAQILTPTGVSTLGASTYTVSADVTRSTS